ncbi:MAG: ATP-dependent DNA helicase RecG [Planctomycetes bacterium]|nr:ATP-dependent DNA helicase RecG [Planctomycetota bacterium]
MNRTELADLIRNGEPSGVEFERDDVHPDKLAKDVAALLNFEGGHVLLGVEKDGTVTGLTRPVDKAEEWVMQVAGNNLQPACIPFWETIDWGAGRIVGIITLSSDAPDKPYKAKRGSAWVTQMRVGTTTRDATKEEEARLYMQAGTLQYDRKPVPGGSLDDFDMRRLVNYFRDVRQQSCPSIEPPESPAYAVSRAAWTRQLINTELMHESNGRVVPGVGGVLLFGKNPKRWLPQSGITAVAYLGREKDYSARERASLRGAVVSLFPPAGTDQGLPAAGGSSAIAQAVDAGVIEQAMSFVRRNMAVVAEIDAGGRRQERWEYPLEAVREAIVNAVAHRDYTITVMDIELSLYEDRLEVISPGRLPNTVTVDKMRAGYRASRNELVKEVLRDYRYIEATGLGVPRKIIEGMRAHNGTEPDLVEEDARFIVRLWKRGGHAVA